MESRIGVRSLGDRAPLERKTVKAGNVLEYLALALST
jgi:hypothetical protein